MLCNTRILLITTTVVVFLFFLAVSSHSGVQKVVVQRVKQAIKDPNASPSCVNFQKKVVDLKAGRMGHAPQLELWQLMQISSALHNRKSTLHLLKHAIYEEASDFLVWGLGYDSRGWIDINCGARTAFIENYPEWIEKIKGNDESMEVHAVEYAWQRKNYTDFVQNPTLLEISGVDNSCFDVILIDAPQGMHPHNPGRMESTYYSLHHARRCIESGKKDLIYIFLHDVNRDTEAKLVKQYLGIDNGVRPLGTLAGEGYLYGGMLDKESVQEYLDTQSKS